jgi:hypothetical protein
MPRTVGFDISPSIAVTLSPVLFKPLWLSHWFLLDKMRTFELQANLYKRGQHFSF